MVLLHTHHPATQRIGLVIGIVVFVIVVFSVSYLSMWELWQTSDHRHGILVFPISIFLIWRARHHLAEIPLAPDARGLLLIVPLTIGWLGARLTGIQALEHATVQLLITAAVVTLAGSRLALKLLFPLVFLVLATPLGESLVPYLMAITADLSAWLLKLSGIPLLRDGQYMTLPGGAFVVAEVCSGLRYLLSGIMVALLFGYLSYSSFRKRVILIAVTVVALVLANGVRAYIVMAVASMTEMRYLGGRDHVYFGWVLFGIIMMTIMWLAAKYADEDGDLPVASAIADASHGRFAALPLIAGLVLVTLALTANPMQTEFGKVGPLLAVALALIAFVLLLLRQSGESGGTRARSAVNSIVQLGWRQLLTIAATLLVLIAVPRFAVVIENRVPPFVYDVDIGSVVQCTTMDAWEKEWQPVFPGADVRRLATLDCSGEAVSYYFAAYAATGQGHELISSSNEIVPADWDRVIRTSSHAVYGGEAEQNTVVEVLVDMPGYRAVIWYWYEIDGRVVSGPVVAKLRQLLALVRGRPAGGSVVVIETVVTTDVERARERLGSVATAVFGAGTYVGHEGAD